MAVLSADALYFAGTMFNMMVPGEGTLIFRMKESRPTARSQAALDELVAAGAISVAPFNQFGGLVYTPLRTFKRPTAAQAKTAGAWSITEPVA